MGSPSLPSLTEAASVQTLQALCLINNAFIVFASKGTAPSKNGGQSQVNDGNVSVIRQAPGSRVSWVNKIITSFVGDMLHLNYQLGMNHFIDMIMFLPELQKPTIRILFH
jgi:hypothetical protein